MCTSPNHLSFLKRSLSYIDKFGVLQYKDKYIFIPHGQDANYDFIRDAVNSYVEVPCGHCLECRLQYSQAWADRCVIESKQYVQNYFVTLSLDDACIKETGLDPEELTRFIKRVRKHFEPTKIKYFACGEYGGQTLRPHYHIIFFNLPLTDLTYLFKTFVRDPLDAKKGHFENIQFDGARDNQYSETIHKLWHYKGNITVSPFHWNKAAYIARYCTGKIDRNLIDWYKEKGKHPEFLRMSQGLGANGYDPKKMLYSDSFIVDGTGRLTFNPRYYERLFIKQFGELDPKIIERKYNKRHDRITTFYANNRNRTKEYWAKNYKLVKRHKIKSKV